MCPPYQGANNLVQEQKSLNKSHWALVWVKAFLKKVGSMNITFFKRRIFLDRGLFYYHLAGGGSTVRDLAALNLVTVVPMSTKGRETSGQYQFCGEELTSW